MMFDFCPNHFDVYLVDSLALKEVETDRQTDWQTDICLSWSAFAAENKQIELRVCLKTCFRQWNDLCWFWVNCYFIYNVYRDIPQVNKTTKWQHLNRDRTQFINIFWIVIIQNMIWSQQPWSNYQFSIKIFSWF